ncbi:MAG TPA: DUF3842 family protein [Clostridia bacterium]|nr:DUF3842 family protein [Clostridia bacterium]
MRLAVIDGQGGGIGKAIVERLRKGLPEEVEIIALGTNSLATVAMLKAGANDGATGENAIVQTVKDVDVIIGTVSIVMANSMLGELTPRMAEAIASARARKLLLPLTRSPVTVVGVVQEPLPHLVDMLVREVARMYGGEKDVRS